MYIHRNPIDLVKRKAGRHYSSFLPKLNNSKEKEKKTKKKKKNKTKKTKQNKKKQQKNEKKTKKKKKKKKKKKNTIYMTFSYIITILLLSRELWKI